MKKEWFPLALVIIFATSFLSHFLLNLFDSAGIIEVKEGLDFKMSIFYSVFILVSIGYMAFSTIKDKKDKDSNGQEI